MVLKDYNLEERCECGGIIAVVKKIWEEGPAKEHKGESFRCSYEHEPVLHDWR